MPIPDTNTKPVDPDPDTGIAGDVNKTGFDPNNIINPVEHKDAGAPGISPTADGQPHWSNGGPDGNRTPGPPVAAVIGGGVPKDPTDDIAHYDGPLKRDGAGFIAALGASGLGEKQAPTNQAERIGEEPDGGVNDPAGKKLPKWEDTHEADGVTPKPKETGQGDAAKQLDRIIEGVKAVKDNIDSRKDAGFVDPDVANYETGIKAALDLSAFTGAPSLADVGLDGKLIDNVLGSNLSKISDLFGARSENKPGNAFDSYLQKFGIDPLDQNLMVNMTLKDLLLAGGNLEFLLDLMVAQRRHLLDVHTKEKPKLTDIDLTN